MEAGAANAIEDDCVNRTIGASVHWENDGQQVSAVSPFFSYYIFQVSRDQSFLAPKDLSTDFHVYKLSWDPEFIRISIDDQQYFEMDISEPEAKSLESFHQRFYLILNLAVGGNYPDISDPEEITAPLPAHLEVEYIRLFQDSNNGSELYLNGAKAYR